MTTEITLLPQSHLPSVYFFSCLFILHFCSPQHSSSLRQPFIFSLHFILFLCCYLASLPIFLSVSPLSVSLTVSSSTLFTILHLCLTIISHSFLVFVCCFIRHAFLLSFSLSISLATSVDHSSKCHLATSATVGFINSFLVGTTGRKTQGEKE